MDSKVSEKDMREVYFQAFGKEYDSADRKQAPLPLEIAYRTARNKLMREGKYAGGGEITDDAYYQSVNHFVYFCMNYQNDFLDAFGSLKTHLSNKFKDYYNKYGTYGVMIHFYIELDSENRRILTDYSFKNYKGTPISSDISKIEYFNSVNHFIYFCFNFPSNFMDAFSSHLKVHLSSKWTNAYEKKGSVGAMIYFWSELDGENRRKLATWSKNNYTGTKLYEVGGALGDVAGMLPSPLPMSTIQAMADGGQLELFADGGGVESDYYIFEGVDNLNGKPLYRVESSSESENEYVGEWHTDKSDAEKELKSFYAGGGVVIYKETDLNRRDGKTKKVQVTKVDSYREALERIEELKRKNKNPNVSFFTGDIYANGGSVKINYSETKTNGSLVKGANFENGLFVNFTKLHKIYKEEYKYGIYDASQSKKIVLFKTLEDAEIFYEQSVKRLERESSISKTFSKDSFADGGEMDDISIAKSNAIDKIDFEYYAKQHAGDSWDKMSSSEKAELMSDIRDNWFNDSEYANGGRVFGDGGDLDDSEEFANNNDDCINSILDMVSEVKPILDYGISDKKLIIVLKEQLTIDEIEFFNNNLKNIKGCSEVTDDEFTISYKENNKTLILNLKTDDFSIQKFKNGGAVGELPLA